MKTTGIIFFTIDLLKTLYTGYSNVKRENDLEELELSKERQHTATWKPYVGIGMMVLGGALLILGRKKSLAA